jgi:hypothetical protein
LPISARKNDVGLWQRLKLSVPAKAANVPDVHAKRRAQPLDDVQPDRFVLYELLIGGFTDPRKMNDIPRHVPSTLEEEPELFIVDH